MAKQPYVKPAVNEAPVEGEQLPEGQETLQVQETVAEQLPEGQETVGDPEQTPPVVEIPAEVIQVAEQVVAVEVVAPVAPAAPVVDSVKTASASVSALDGGLPARAIGFRDYLDRYITEMAPGTSIDPVVGGKRQQAFFNTVINLVKDPDVKVFMAAMEVLVTYIKQNSGDRGVFNMRYANRFAANFGGGKDQAKQWVYLWTILFAVSSDNPKARLAEIDWAVALRQLDESSKVRLQTWCLNQG